MRASEVLKAAGFAGEALNVALGIVWAESNGYSDAVGDVSLITEKWGPSIGLFQIRSLRKPMDYRRPDSLRFADTLRDPEWNAETAYEISKGGTVWTAWSTYNSGSWKTKAGQDFDLKSGHPRASEWSK